MMILDEEPHGTPPPEIVRLRISGLKPPEDPRAFVRVFLNCAYLTPATPINDPHFVASIAFFLSGGEMDGMHHAQGGLDHVIDLTETLDALRRSDNYPVIGIEPQLLAFNGDGKPTGMTVDGKFEVEFLRAEKA